MGQLVFILGRSGTGKSFSMRNFPSDKLAVINVQGKILPFRGAAKIETTDVDQSDKIVKALEIYAKNYKSIVVDDYQYVMANEFMRRSAERGYDKFTEIGRHAWDIANTVRSLPADVIVYVMCHTDRDDEGNEKIKTIGKMLDEKICLEGMSTIVLKTNVSDGQYSFLTQNNGRDTTKSPDGMFPSYAVENDLYYVDQKIRNYYVFTGSLTDEEMTEIDEAAKKVNIIKDDGKKGRRRAKKEEPTNISAEEKKEETEKSDTTTSANSSTDAESKPTSRRSRRSSDKSREEVAAENAEKVANAGMEEAGDEEEVDFDKVENPPTEKLPRRRRGAKNEQKQENDSSEKEEAEESQEEEKPAQEDAGKISSRRRKDRSEEQVMNQPEEPEVTEEPATNRRRRRRG